MRYTFFVALLFAACGGSDDSTSVHDALTVIADPAEVAIDAGTQANVDILLTRLGSFTDATVTLSVSGSPSGVAATFDQTSTAGNFATLTLVVDPTATQGAASLTINASSGATTATAALALTVQAPGHISTH
jgi:hypothetical protein